MPKFPRAGGLLCAAPTPARPGAGKSRCLCAIFVKLADMHVKLRFAMCAVHAVAVYDIMCALSYAASYAVIRFMFVCGSCAILT